MKKDNIFIVILVLLNIILMILRIKVGDPSYYQGDMISLAIFIFILCSLGYLFITRKFDYFILLWLSFYFAAPIIKVPFVEIGSLGILNGIFIPLMLIKTFNVKNKYFLLIFSFLVLSILNTSEVSIRILLSRIFNFIAPLLFFYFTTKTCKKPKLIMQVIILIALVNVPLSLYEIFFKPAWAILIDWRGYRIYGNLFWPNSYSLYLITPILLLYMNIRNKFDVKTLAALIILMVINVFTLSRAGLLVLAVSITLFEIIYKTGFRFTFKKIVIFFFMISTFIIYKSVDFTNNRLESSTIIERTHIWETIIPIIMSNLLFGNGLGSYELFRDQILYGLSTHNYYLNILFELGLVGLIILLSFIILMIVHFIKKMKQKHELNVGQTGIVLIIVALMYSFVGNAAFTEVVSLNLWIALGCLLIYKKKVDK